jgi:ABC-2 type transport system permease protein
MHIEWLAIEKVVAGMIQAIVAGLVVIPTGWLVMGGVSFEGASILRFALVAILVAALSATLGLVLGCTIGQQHVGLMFSMVMAPMIFFGCTYYPWAALEKFPILRRVVLINPLVYASEGFRSALVPRSPHLAIYAIIGALIAFDTGFLLLGLRQFRRKAIS